MDTCLPFCNWLKFYLSMYWAISSGWGTNFSYTDWFSNPKLAAYIPKQHFWASQACPTCHKCAKYKFMISPNAVLVDRWPISFWDMVSVLLRLWNNNLKLHFFCMLDLWLDSQNISLRIKCFLTARQFMLEYFVFPKILKNVLIFFKKYCSYHKKANHRK